MARSNFLALAALVATLSAGSTSAALLLDASRLEGPRPVTKVVQILKEMHEEVEREAKEDEELHSKMQCWCETNEREKTAAIEAAKIKIDDLTTAIETGTARVAQLKSDISALKEEMQDAQDSLTAATKSHEKAKAEYEEDEQNMMDALGPLTEAVEILSKVQLLQENATVPKPEAKRQEATALMQVQRLLRPVAKTSFGSGAVALGANQRFAAVAQQDLWDLLGSFPGGVRRGPVAELAQQPTGAAAGAKSYNARSSTVLGILRQMKETFGKDLAETQKNHLEDEIAFQRLRAAKQGELEAASASMKEKSEELADTNEKVSQAKVDIEATRDALSADEKFLVEVKEKCATAERDYDTRSKTRGDEMAAISETIMILTSDEARDLASNTTSLLQSGSAHRMEASAKARELRSRAAAALMSVAKSRGSARGLQLARLAVGVRIDAFTKVKEMMDTMIAELKKQQKAEYEKHESCKQEIGSNEGETRVKTSEHKDTEAEITGLTGQMDALSGEISDLKAQIGQMQVSIQQASETRKAENEEFKQVVTDQRAMVDILKKALERLRRFYAGKPKSLLAEGRRASRQSQSPPPEAKTYKKAGASSGVIQMLEKILQDAQEADKEAVSSEQAAETAYASFVADANAALEAAENAQVEKEAARSKAEADKLIAEDDLRAVITALSDLSDVNQALHMDCDYLLKNFDLRQQSRQQEVEAIQQAKQILSGADFGDA